MARLLAFLITGLLVVGVLAVSMLITCGIMALICLCFGWTFSWPTAIGIWLIMCLLRSTFKSSIKK